MSQRQSVKNAADRDQVDRAGRDDARNAKRYQDALFNMMNTPDGRIVFTNFLRAAGIGVGERGDSVFHNSGSVMAHKSGQLDLGLDLQEALKRSSLRLYHLMESEARAIIETEGLENR